MDIESKQPLTDLTRKHTWRERPREGRQTKIRREMWSTTTVGPQTLSSSCTPHFYSTWPSYRSPSEQSTLASWRETFLYKQVSSDSHIRLLTNPARRWSNSQSQKLSRVPSANRNGPPRYRHRSGRFVWTPSDICHPFVIGMRWHKKKIRCLLSGGTCEGVIMLRVILDQKRKKANAWSHVPVEWTHNISVPTPSLLQMQLCK